MKQIFIPFLLLILVACASTGNVTVTSEVTVTSTFSPTSTTAPTATITLTPAPSLPADFPPEFQDQLADKQVDQVDSDGDGQVDKITDPATGETLFQLDAQAEWLRIITFTITEGEKIEMPRFETFDDALKYISKHAYWRTGSDWMKQLDNWSSNSNPRINEYIPIFSKIKKIPNWSAYQGLASPYNSDKFILLSLNKVGKMSLLRFEPEKNWFEIVYINEPVTAFDQGGHSVPTPQP